MDFLPFFLLILFFQNSFATPPLILEGIPSIPKSRSTKQLKQSFQNLKFDHRENRAILWWLQFREGEMIPDLFCGNMEALSKEKDFPLSSLAGIYFYEQCSPKEKLTFNIENFPDWLKPLAALSSYRRGKKTSNKKQILNAALKLARLSPYEELQISYQQHARRLARELKDSRLKKIERELFQMAPRLNPQVHLKNYLPVANDFRKVRNFKKARYWYLKILKSSEARWGEKNQSFKWLAWMYKQQKNTQKLLKTTRQWSKWLSREKNTKAWKSYYKNQLNIVRRYWNLDQNQAALDLLDVILNEEKAAIVKEEVHWLRGLIKAGEGLLEESLKEFDMALLLFEKNGENISFEEKILWKKAWVLRELNQLVASLQVLKKLARRAESSAIRARASFWIGESQVDLKRRFAAARTFRSLRREDPIGYYGLMASYRLNKAPLFSLENKYISLEKMNMNTEDIYITQWLLSLRKNGLLRTFLESRKKTLKVQKEKTFDDWLALVSLYKATDRYLDIFQTFFLMPPSLQELFIESYGGLLFPLAFQKEVEKESITQKVSPALLLALIRQESAFNQKARSPSDAFGLMQLIPSTARAMAKKIRTPYKGYVDLYNAEKNIRLGTAYFKKLLSQYNGSLILATAAYNAGGTPVKKWRTDLNKTHPLSFIESIPYRETRIYVKLVIRNFIIYNKILRDLYKTTSHDKDSGFSIFNVAEAPPFAPKSSEEAGHPFPKQEFDETSSISELSDRKELWHLLLRVYYPPQQKSHSENDDLSKSSVEKTGGSGMESVGFKEQMDKSDNEIEESDNKETDFQDDRRFFFSRFLDWIFNPTGDADFSKENKERFSFWFPENLFFID